jgi:hypothetical protein
MQTAFAVTGLAGAEADNSPALSTDLNCTSVSPSFTTMKPLTAIAAV